MIHDKRICFVSHSSGQRGAERALLEAIDALKCHSVIPSIIAPRPGPLLEQAQSSGIEVTVCPMFPWVTRRKHPARSIAKTLTNFLLLLPLARAIRRSQCDLVYTNTFAVPNGALVASFLGIPHIWHIHEFADEDHGFLFDIGRPNATVLFRKLGGHFIFNSWAVAREFGRKYGSDLVSKRGRVIYQSVTLPSDEAAEPIRAPRASGATLLLVGALEKNKGQDDAIQAIASLRKLGRDVALVLVGDGPYKSRLVELAQSLHISAQVCFVGFSDDVGRWYREADVVLVCSRGEAFGRVAVEGMLCNRVVVAANSGGLPEIVEHGRTGLLYEQGNIADLTRQIDHILSNRSYARTLAQQGQDRAQRSFTQNAYGASLFAYISELI